MTHMDSSKTNKAKASTSMKRNRPHSSHNNLQDEVLLHRPAYQHAAYMVQDVPALLTKLAAVGVKPINNKLLTVTGKNIQSSRHYPSWHTNVYVNGEMLNNPMLRPHPKARMRITTQASHGTRFMNTQPGVNGKFPLVGHCEMVRPNNKRMLCKFPNQRNGVRIINTPLKNGQGTLFLDSTIHSTPAERDEGSKVRLIAFSELNTSFIQNLMRQRTTKRQPAKTLTVTTVSMGDDKGKKKKRLVLNPV